MKDWNVTMPAGPGDTSTDYENWLQFLTGTTSATTWNPVQNSAGLTITQPVTITARYNRLGPVCFFYIGIHILGNVGAIQFAANGSFVLPFSANNVQTFPMYSATSGIANPIFYMATTTSQTALLINQSGGVVVLNSPGAARDWNISGMYYIV